MLCPFTRVASRRGAVYVSVALGLTALLGMAACSIDAGRVIAAQRAQNVAEAAGRGPSRLTVCPTYALCLQPPSQAYLSSRRYLPWPPPEGRSFLLGAGAEHQNAESTRKLSLRAFCSRSCREDLGVFVASVPVALLGSATSLCAPLAGGIDSRFALPLVPGRRIISWPSPGA
jgi:hypothetical protein